MLTGSEARAAPVSLSSSLAPRRRARAERTPAGRGGRRLATPPLGPPRRAHAARTFVVDAGDMTHVDTQLEIFFKEHVWSPCSMFPRQTLQISMFGAHEAMITSANIDHGPSWTTTMCNTTFSISTHFSLQQKYPMLRFGVYIPVIKRMKYG